MSRKGGRLKTLVKTDGGPLIVMPLGETALTNGLIRGLGSYSAQLKSLIKNKEYKHLDPKSPSTPKLPGHNRL